MTLPVLRTADAWWLQRPEGAVRIATDATTTAELLADRAAVLAARDAGDPVPVTDLALVSPVTAPCRVVAQMANYASHAKDAGMDPGAVPLAFFRKASGSINGPHDDIVRPAHVTLLDYEVEIGLVIGREVPMCAYGPSGSGLLSWLVSRRVRPDVNAYLMRNHGAIGIATNFEQAGRVMELLEQEARDWFCRALQSQSHNSLCREALRSLND